jgi:hypothetical protein
MPTTDRNDISCLSSKPDKTSGTVFNKMLMILTLFQALAALRTALKKERGNSRLYSQIIDMCYQRHPVDVMGRQFFSSLSRFPKPYVKGVSFIIVQYMVYCTITFHLITHLW